MVQADVTPWVSYVSDGVLTTFAYTWYVSASSDIEAYHNSSLTTAYTVTGVGSTSGGTLVFFTPPAAGTIFIRRRTPQTQLVDLVDNDSFFANTAEGAFDKCVRMIQDLDEDLSRRPALAVSVGNALRNLALPSPGALQLIGWNADGTALTLYNSALVTITVSPTSGRATGKTTTTVNASSGAGTSLLTATTAVPAGVLLMGVSARVTTTCGNSGGLTTWSLGDADISDRWGTGLARTSGTLTNAGQWRMYQPLPAPSAMDILLVADAGLWDSTGVIKVTSHWETFQADA